MAWRPPGFRPVSGIPDSVLADTRVSDDEQLSPNQGRPVATRPAENVSNTSIQITPLSEDNSRPSNTQSTTNEQAAAVSQNDSVQSTAAAESRSRVQNDGAERPRKRRRAVETSHQRASRKNLERIPYIRAYLEHQTARERAEYLSNLAVDDEYMYTAWIFQYPEDIDLLGDRPASGDERREYMLADAREGVDASVEYGWQGSFGDWSWERPVVEPPEADIGPRDETEL
ncbi:hypothetical protein LTR36_005928 [Oleoguttula mirabilis]|uniref:Uncharacterized protein n=1 Tax=Oleoguttula mirabilis TaxID=1507867 RepID=A0AAV9JDE4_9PEZI|nr:hypothetical protein LTR36_005928 [Oleoguttula mirabilis]